MRYKIGSPHRPLIRCVDRTISKTKSINLYIKIIRAQDSRASPENPRIQTVIRADPRKADDISSIFGFVWVVARSPRSSRSPRYCPAFCSIPSSRPPPRVCKRLLFVERGCEGILFVTLTGCLFLFYFQSSRPFLSRIWSPSFRVSFKIS